MSKQIKECPVCHISPAMPVDSNVNCAHCGADIIEKLQARIKELKMELELERMNNPTNLLSDKIVQLESDNTNLKEQLGRAENYLQDYIDDIEMPWYVGNRAKEYFKQKGEQK